MQEAWPDHGITAVIVRSGGRPLLSLGENLTLSKRFVELAGVCPGWERLLVWERFNARAGCTGVLAVFTGSVVITVFDL
jgi:hypothetical protein